MRSYLINLLYAFDLMVNALCGGAPHQTISARWGESPSIPAVKWVMSFMKADGIDIGSPATQGMLDQLAAGGVITPDEANKLKSMGIAPASRAEVVFGQMVSPSDVSETRRV